MPWCLGDTHRKRENLAFKATTVPRAKQLTAQRTPELYDLREVNMLSERFPKFGCYPHWPESGTDWIHPDDVDQANELLPSYRVLRRDRFDGEFYHHTYGAFRLRFRPAMWLEIRGEDIVVGDQIELQSRDGENEPAIGRIVEIFFQPKTQSITYHVQTRDYVLPKPFSLDDFVCLTSHPQLRPSNAAHPTPKQLPTGIDRLPLE